MRHKERENYRKKKLYKVLPFMAALCVCGSSIGGTVYAESAEPTVDMVEETSEADENTSAENSDTSSENETAEPTVSDGRNFQTEIAKPDNVEQDGYDVIFAIDNSGSVKKKQREARCNALKSIVNRMVGSDFNVGIIYFSGKAYNTYGLASMKNEDSAKEVLEHLTTVVEGRPDKNTNISSALKVAQTFLADSNPNRQPVIVLCSDGTNENKEHDLAYQEEADAATAEIVRQLKNRGNAPSVPIYCVYLKQLYKDADKLALEEEKLKEIVNYCPEEGESYEDFSADRFYTVTNEEIENLTSSFEDVFFKMQNNVRKRDLNFDDSWKDQLYIPSLAVSKVNIYINKPVELLNSYNDGRAFSSDPKWWITEDATFFSLENPSAGDWWFQITSSDVDLSGISGQVTYIANPGVSVEMVLLDNDNTDGEKQYQIRVHFYDENGEEITVDPGATVQVYREDINENGESTLFMPYLQTENGLITSVPQTWEGYGDYNYQVRVSYKDYIDLHYTFNTLTVAGTAPVTTDITDGVYETEKTETENGSAFQFAIRESDLWKDPDGSEVTVTGITQVNTANPVNYEQRDGYVYITAEKAGDVEFSLNLENTSGMTAVASVKGKIKDLAEGRKVKSTIKIVIVVAVLGVIFKALRKINKKGKVNSESSKFEDLAKEIENTGKECKKLVVDLNENNRMIQACLHGNPARRKPGIIEMSWELKDGLRELFHMEQYENPDFGADISKLAKEGEDTLEKILNRVQTLRAEEKTLSDPNSKAAKRGMNYVLDRMKKNRIESEKNLQEVKKLKESLQNKKTEAAQITETVVNLGGEMFEIISGTIKCTLKVTDISCCPGISGIMSATGFDGKYMLNCYGLGEVDLIGLRNTNLGNKVKPLDIYVYGYENEEGMKGLKLKGKDLFIIKEKNETEETETDQAILLQDHSYILTVSTDIGEVQMQLTVE